MTTDEILKELNLLKDENYKNFNIKNIPTKQKIIGVRIPILKKTAQKISLNDYVNFIYSDKHNIFELIMLEGLTLSYLKKNFSVLQEDIENYINKVDNWAQIDYVFQNFKSVKKEKEVVLKTIKKMAASKNEFEVRAALVLLLTFFIEKEYINNIFEISNKISNKDYYSLTANAWLISICMYKFPNDTMNFIKDKKLDSKTLKLTIRKIKESLLFKKEKYSNIKKFVSEFSP